MVTISIVPAGDKKVAMAPADKVSVIDALVGMIALPNPVSVRGDVVQLACGLDTCVIFMGYH
jgi:hypothetical protein